MVKIVTIYYFRADNTRTDKYFNCPVDYTLKWDDESTSWLVRCGINKPKTFNITYCPKSEWIDPELYYYQHVMTQHDN